MGRDPAQRGLVTAQRGWGAAGEGMSHWKRALWFAGLSQGIRDLSFHQDESNLQTRRAPIVMVSAFPSFPSTPLAIYTYPSLVLPR